MTYREMYDRDWRLNNWVILALSGACVVLGLYLYKRGY